MLVGIILLIVAVFASLTIGLSSKSESHLP
jgi:hypothetical protein